MLTILTLEILNGRRSSNENIKISGNNISGSEISDKLKAEQIRIEKNERMENFIIIMPVLIMLLGIIIMYILDLIFSK